MIFDDHDVHDDWNTSAAWVAEYRAKPWWDRRIVGAFSSYWIYQHLGNMSPRELADPPVFDNQVATLELNGRRAELRIDRALPVDSHAARLECSVERRLA